MNNKHLYTLEEMKCKRDRLYKSIQNIPRVRTVGLGKGDSLVVLFTQSGSEELLPKEFEGCAVTFVLTGEAIAY